ncbi:MAG: hypothetical protein JWR26_1154 [Pedosphaera sp.]|nr:hypothetical protein [Pedosphaera sp.]
MKITLTYPVAGGPNGTFVLVDSPANIQYTNFRINGSRNIQEAQFFRATARQFMDRGNRKTEVTFDATRLFANQVAAESFIFMHETMFPGQFLAAFTAGVAGAGATATKYLKNATVEAVSSSLMGCTGKFSYRITGGVMSATPN